MTRVKKAVEEFEKADRELKDFMDKNNEFFQEFHKLVETRNIKCEKARDVIKRHETSHGDFQYSRSRSFSFDVPLLKERLPKGVFDRITKISIDRKAVDVLLERGEIEEESLEGAFEVEWTKKCIGPKSWKLEG